MSLAVCLVCGTHKRGALLPCPACDWEPVDDEDRARSVLLTEHHHDEAELDRLADALAGGADVVVPDALLAQQLGCDGQRQARARLDDDPPRAPVGTPAGDAQAAAIASLGELVRLEHSRHRYIHAGRHGAPLVDDVVRRALEHVLALGDAPDPTHAAWLARLLCLPYAPHVALAVLQVLGRGDGPDDPGRAAERLAALPPPWPARAHAALEHLVEVVSGPPYPRQALETLTARLA